MDTQDRGDRVVLLTIKQHLMEALQKSLYCHSERSEESINSLFKNKLPLYISAGSIIDMNLCKPSL